jgi:AcrR family transcriptional regulator
MTAPLDLRADARRNREKLVRTASVVFREYGLDGSLDEIAKRAGVGRGTLYRHFPTRDELITAVFLERMAETVANAERALELEDPWEGFAQYVRETCRAQASDRAMADLTAIGHPSPELRTLRTRGYNVFTKLIDRAKASGALRPDFTPEDFILLTMAISGITRHTGRTAAAATDRFIALALDGLRADAANPAPPAISPRTMLSRLRQTARTTSTTTT